MKKKQFLFTVLMISLIFGQWKDLTFEDVFSRPPFENATIGQWNWLPGEDSYIFFQMDTIIQARSLYRYELDSGDTSLFVSGDKFFYDGNILQLSDYEISNDHKKLLLITDQQRIWRHSRTAICYLFDLETSTVYLIASGERLRNVKFSPNSESIAFLKPDNNLYTFHFGNKKEVKLTKNGSSNILNGHFGWVYEEEFGSYDAYRWSPDSKYIAFVREDQTFVKQFPMMDELQTYPEIKYHHYPKVGESNPVLNIGIVNVKTKKTRWLDLRSDKEMYHPRMNWLSSNQTESGKPELVVTRINRHQNLLEFVKYDIKKGKGNTLWSDDSEAWVNLTDDVYFLEDGSFVTLSERSGYTHIYHFDRNGDMVNQVTTGDWEVSGISALDEESRVIHLFGKKDSSIESNLYSVNLDGSNFKLLDERLGSHRANYSPSNKYYIDSFSTANIARAISLHSADGSKIKDLSVTDMAQFEDYGFSEVKFINVPTTDDGTILNAMIALPRDFDPIKKYPVIVFGYSGPGSQVVANRQGGLLSKYFNQEGYITFSIDPRGTGGRGTDFKYLSYGDIGKWVVIDQVEGAKYLATLPYVDKDRIGIWGWSGGGTMTALCMTKGAPYFKVGVAVAPVSDFRLYDTIWTERYMGLLDENEAGYDSTNIMNYADKLEGKLLMIHGTGDDNVHPQNTVQLMDSFVNANKQADMYLYANRNHGIYGGNTTFHLWTKILNYFKDNL